jgi:hypothetical protein
MKNFAVSLETWDEESLEAGETDQNVYIQNLTLREAIDEIRSAGGNASGPGDGGIENSGSWFTFYSGSDGDSFQDGESTNASLFPPSNVTKSSYKRIARLIGAH